MIRSSIKNRVMIERGKEKVYTNLIDSYLSFMPNPVKAVDKRTHNIIKMKYFIFFKFLWNLSITKVWNKNYEMFIVYTCDKMLDSFIGTFRAFQKVFPYFRLIFSDMIIPYPK